MMKDREAGKIKTGKKKRSVTKKNNPWMEISNGGLVLGETSARYQQGPKILLPKHQFPLGKKE